MKGFVYILICIFLCACSGHKEETTVFEGTAMSVPYRIVIGKKLQKEEKKSVEESINEVFLEIDAIFNNWNPLSELSLINDAPADTAIKISPSLALFLERVRNVFYETEGFFDPSVYPLYTLWKHALEEYRIPDRAEIEEMAHYCGFDKFHLENGSIWKEHQESKLDLCGIVKGYCVDLLTEAIESLGYPDALIEWGGEMRAMGYHPSNRNWQILISPVSHALLPPIQLENESVATSGDTWSHWEVDGISYCHIIHPKTGMPLISSSQSIASVTVIAPSCMLADCLATTLMLFATPEEAYNFGSKLKCRYPEVQFWIQTREGTTLAFN